MALVAYADYVTVILRSAQEAQVVQDAIHMYEKASGALLNYRKSKALVLKSLGHQFTTFGAGIFYRNKDPRN
jgi:hypothetical protein